MERMSLDRELSRLGLRRDSRLGVGKRVGGNLWLHKSYASEFIPQDLLKSAESKLPNWFCYDVVRVSRDQSEICFIFSPDFDSSNEPMVSDSFLFRVDEVEGLTLKSHTKPQKDPLIYHHKWMFVRDDYRGFSVSDSKERSLNWKALLGVNRSSSSKIGRLSFWDSWLAENCLSGRLGS